MTQLTSLKDMKYIFIAQEDLLHILKTELKKQSPRISYLIVSWIWMIIFNFQKVIAAPVHVVGSKPFTLGQIDLQNP